MTASRGQIRSGSGSGAGCSADRFEPAVDLAERGALDYLVFECLAEPTIARETLTLLTDTERGYTPYLAERFQSVLPARMRNGVRIVTNLGAANPTAGARAVRRETQALGRGDIAVAVVSGDAVLDRVRADPQPRLMENGEPLESPLPRGDHDRRRHMSVRVYDLGHARAGDQGDRSSISVTAYDEAACQVLREQPSIERVAHAVRGIAGGSNKRRMSKCESA